jgi:hypothetical protein
MRRVKTGLYLVMWLVLILLLCGTQPAGATGAGPYKIYLPLWAPEPMPKLGMAGCPVDCEIFGCGWCYSWCSDPGTRPNIETVPMVWGRKQMHLPVGGNSDWLMQFNEPDLRGQSDLTLDDAIALTYEIEALHPTKRMVSPAPSHVNQNWLRQFRAAFYAAYARYPRWDALGMHCYLSLSECITLAQQFIADAAAWQVPEVWITEWVAWSEADARRFMAWVEAQPAITRYAVYVSRQDCSDGTWNCELSGDPSLLEANGVTLTEHGQWYARSLWP